MPSRPDRLLMQPRFLMISVAILLAAGFGLTMLIFYPGVMTYDAKFVYEDIAKGTLGDWQSPVMAWLWGLIDPVAPGAGSMFLLIATTVAFAASEQRSPIRLTGQALALALVILGMLLRPNALLAAPILAAYII